MKKTILAALAILLISCKEQAIKREITNNDSIEVGLLFEKDGCKVYRFYDGGEAIYYTDCRGKVYYEHATQSGKSRIVHRIQNQTVD